MIAYPDTSFLHPLYRPQVQSALASRYYREMPEPLHAGSLLLFEFRQSIRLHCWLYRNDPSRGISQELGEACLALIDEDLSRGVIQRVRVDWDAVHGIANALSARQTSAKGHRAMDILHVATALELGCTVFLSFDERQRELAASEGLVPKP